MFSSPLNAFFDTLEQRRLFAVDLYTLGVQITSFDPVSGNLDYNAQIANSGSTDAPPLATGALFLTKDLVVNNADDVRLATIPASETPHTSQKTLSGTLRVPGTTPAGTYYLGVALDIDSNVNELHEDNNFSFSPTTITVPKTFAVDIQGTADADKITVQYGKTGNIDIIVNGVTTSYAIDRMESLSIEGLEGNDTITVLPLVNFPVYINGGDGNDLISGGAANDVLTGGPGKDTIHGGAGNDRINGAGGNDILLGETGPDRLFGGAGNDYLDGGPSGDHLNGGPGFDSMYGQGGADVFTSNDGQVDLLFGGTGKDTSTADANDIRASVLG